MVTCFFLYSLKYIKRKSVPVFLPSSDNTQWKLISGKSMNYSIRTQKYIIFFIIIYMQCYN